MPLSVVATVLQLTAIAVGCFVAYQSYRGYRRNDSRAMLALAIGLVLLIPVAYLVEFTLGTLQVLDPTTAALVSQAVGIAGLVVIFYGLMRP